MIVHRGVVLPDDIVRHARTYVKKHLGPVIVTDGRNLFVRKGSRTVRLSEKIVFDGKETAQIVQNWSEP